MASTFVGASVGASRLSELVAEEYLIPSPEPSPGGRGTEFVCALAVARGEIKPQHGALRLAERIVGVPFGGGNIFGTDPAEALAFEEYLRALLGRAGEHVGEARGPG